MSTPLEEEDMNDKPYNVDLLMQVREKIVTEPETHDQARWASAQNDPRKGGDCGTAYCVAGWAAVLDGQRLNWYRAGDDWFAYSLESGRPIWRHAQEALGLGSPEEDALFSSDHSRETVLSMLDRLIEAGKNGERVPEGEL